MQFENRDGLDIKRLQLHNLRCANIWNKTLNWENLIRRKPRDIKMDEILKHMIRFYSVKNRRRSLSWVFRLVISASNIPHDHLLGVTQHNISNISSAK